MNGARVLFLAETHMEKKSQRIRSRGYRLASAHVRLIQRSAAIGQYVAAEGEALRCAKQLL